MKYIDADKLIAEIERLIGVHTSKRGQDEVAINLNYLKEFITSLQQEQPEMDLEKEIEEYFKGWTETNEGIACYYQYVDLNTCRGIARYFYEFELKVRKEE